MKRDAPPGPAVVLAALALCLLPAAPSFGRAPERRRTPPTTAVMAHPSRLIAQPTPTSVPTPVPVAAPPPAPPPPRAIKAPPRPEIEGTFSVSGSAAEVRVMHLFGDVFYFTSSEGWEGVGILEGSVYRGVFRYRGSPDPQLDGVTGRHTIDWTSPDSASIQAEFTSLRSGQFDQGWRRITTRGERPVEKPVPPTEPPPGKMAAPGRRPAFGEYVYVEVLPEAVTKVAPRYPGTARRAGIEGTVMVQALVLEDGTVGECRVAQSVPGLDEAAVACIRQWRFKPATSKGVPMKVWVTAPVKFTLR